MATGWRCSHRQQTGLRTALRWKEWCKSDERRVRVIFSASQSLVITSHEWGRNKKLYINYNVLHKRDREDYTQSRVHNLSLLITRTHIQRDTRKGPTTASCALFMVLKKQQQQQQQHSTYCTCTVVIGRLISHHVRVNFLGRNVLRLHTMHSNRLCG